jgi:hypothetical protein
VSIHPVVVVESMVAATSGEHNRVVFGHRFQHGISHEGTGVQDLHTDHFILSFNSTVILGASSMLLLSARR